MKQENTISQRVKQRRTEIGLTQSEVAELAGITQQSFQQIEAGETKRPRHLLEIAQALKCSAGWLVFGDEPKSAA